MSSAVNQSQLETRRTPSGGSYFMTTDNLHYVLLAFRGTEYGFVLEEDAAYLRDEFFRQGCACVSLLFGGEDVSCYLNGLDFMFEPYKKLFCFFNKEKLCEAKSADGKIVIYYPKEYSDLACIFSTHDSEAAERSYRVFNERVREMKQTDENMTTAQFLGYAVNNGRTEYIYGAATT